MEASVPVCPKCQAVIPREHWNVPAFVACAGCADELRAEVFPSINRPLGTGGLGEKSVTADDAECFFHEGKKAEVVCDACGRFLCGLCDCKLHGGHYCPTCLGAAPRTQAVPNLEVKRSLYDRQAFILAVFPLFITGIIAIFMVWRYWKAPTSLVEPRPWMMKAALVIGVLQTLAFTVGILVLWL